MDIDEVEQDGKACLCYSTVLSVAYAVWYASFDHRSPSYNLDFDAVRLQATYRILLLKWFKIILQA